MGLGEEVVGLELVGGGGEGEVYVVKGVVIDDFGG